MPYEEKTTTVVFTELNHLFQILGGRIDHALHENWAKLAFEEVKMFDKTIETVRRLTNEDDTLIVVTADHSHSVNLIGYPYRNTSILGIFTFTYLLHLWCFNKCVNLSGFSNDFNHKL